MIVWLIPFAKLTPYKYDGDSLNEEVDFRVHFFVFITFIKEDDDTSIIGTYKEKIQCHSSYNFCLASSLTLYCCSRISQQLVLSGGFSGFPTPGCLMSTKCSNLHGDLVPQITAYTSTRYCKLAADKDRFVEI